MSSSALYTSVFSAKVNNIQNAADTSAIYSSGAWDFKNASAVTSVRIDASGNVGVGTASPVYKLHVQSGSGVASYIGLAGNNNNLVTSGLAVGQDTAGLTRMYQFGANPITFWTNDTERMRIDASGQITFGSTSSGSLTHTIWGRDASGNADVSGLILRSPGVGNRQYIGLVTDDTNGWSGFKATKDGGLSGTTIRLYAGATYATFSSGGSSWTFVSDRNLKKHIANLSYGLNEVLKLKPVKFAYIADEEATEGKNLGFIAQDVEQVLPELVKTMPEGTLTLAQTELVAVLVKAVQELSAKVDAQAAEIEALKAK